MKLYIESCNALDQVNNEFNSKEELVQILETAQDNDLTLSPIEAATLQLTMRQIDNGFDIPTHESYRNSPGFYTTLATESLKENMANGWKKFIEMIKKIYKEIQERIRKMIAYVKSKFKRKPGDKNRHFEREGNEASGEENKDAPPEEETTQGEFIEKVRAYKLSPLYFEYDGNKSVSAMLRLLQNLPSFIGLANKLFEVYDVRKIVDAALNFEDKAFDDFAQGLAQSTVDIMSEAGGKMSSGGMVCSLSENVYLSMDFHKQLSFPKVEIEEPEVETLEVTDEFIQTARQLGPAITNLFKALEKFFIFGIPDFSRVQDERAQQRISKLMPLYSERCKTMLDLSKFSTDLLEVAEGILADVYEGK